MTGLTDDALDATRMSAPRLRPGSATVVSDGDLIYWTAGRTPHGVDRFAAALVRHLDGVSRVADLSADLASVVGRPQREVDEHVVTTLVRLARHGLLEGLDEWIWKEDDETRAVAEEVLPDGRIVTSVTLEFSTSNPTDHDLVVGLMNGDRSAIDAVPADSCVGQKLRVGEPADRFVTSVGGRRLAVRSTHDQTSALLEQVLDWADGDDDGATVAVVAGPFEGSGPLRVYDAGGERVGRPRSAEDAVVIVGGLVNELSPGPEVGAVAVSATPVLSGERCALLPSSFATNGRSARQLERHGFEVVPVRRVLLGRDRVSVEGAFGALAVDAELVGVLVPDRNPELSPLTRASLQLLERFVTPTVASPTATLERVVELVSAGTFVMRPLPVDVRDVIDEVSNLLEG